MVTLHVPTSWSTLIEKPHAGLVSIARDRALKETRGACIAAYYTPSDATPPPTQGCTQ